MKRLSLKDVQKIKASGKAVKTVVKKPRKVTSKTPKLEQSLNVLNGYVKQIITKKDRTEIVMDSISKTLEKTVDKIDSLQAQSVEKIKAWDITVQRDNEKLIKSLSMKAG